MPTCLTCGAPFYPQSAAWGDETCGHCIADRIEFILSAGRVERQRKPMRRATSDPSPVHERTGQPVPKVASG